MLIAHAASTCDVCLENYSESISYHSIPCGHIFCLSCLINTDPPRCPLCRHEYNHFNIRKIHLTLPSSRDVEARQLEMKLVQSDPTMTLAESLELFEEVQAWLEGEPQGDFLVLRALAAVLCGFHETKDKLREREEQLVSSKAAADETIADLRRRLEQTAESSGGSEISDIDEYRTKFRSAELELAELQAECAALRAQIAKRQEQEEEDRVAYESLRSQNRAIKDELGALRADYVGMQAQLQRHSREEKDFRSEIDRHRREKKALEAACQKYYRDCMAMMEKNAQAHHQALIKAQQEQAAAIVARRQSNPLPPPPQPIRLSSLKLGKPGAEDKGKGKDQLGDSNEDPLTSEYVPTLAAAIAAPGSSKYDHSDSEVTTLIYKAPERMPWLPESSKAESSIKAARKESSAKAAPGGTTGLVRPALTSFESYDQRQVPFGHNKAEDEERPPSPGPSKVRARADSQQGSTSYQSSWYELFPGQVPSAAVPRRATTHARSSRRASSPSVTTIARPQAEYRMRGHAPDATAFQPVYHGDGDGAREYPTSSHGEPFPTRDGSSAQQDAPTSKIIRRVRHDSYNYVGPSQSSQYGTSQARPNRAQAEPHGTFIPPLSRRESAAHSYGYPAGGSSAAAAAWPMNTNAVQVSEV